MGTFSFIVNTACSHLPNKLACPFIRQMQVEGQINDFDLAGSGELTRLKLNLPYFQGSLLDITGESKHYLQ